MTRVFGPIGSLLLSLLVPVLAIPTVTPAPAVAPPLVGWVAAVAVPAAGLGGRSPLAEPGYRAPLAGQLHVLQPFQPPPEPYQAGHLGVDLAARRGTSVLAAASGTVRFAGSVAGRGVLVITHPDGISTEYEPVTALVRKGVAVRAGQVIGRLAGNHRSCQPASCLHWGARRGPQYLDPLSLLGRPVPLGVLRLVPWDFDLEAAQARG
ncbi:MAG: M23 family metallopeptidase [Jatrophihabitantaceae bacterium]